MKRRGFIAGDRSDCEHCHGPMTICASLIDAASPMAGAFK
jgi:hypothetical protein